MGPRAPPWSRRARGTPGYPPAGDLQHQPRGARARCTPAVPCERDPTASEFGDICFHALLIVRSLALLTPSRHGLLEALGPDHERTRDAAARLAKIRGDGAADG